MYIPEINLTDGSRDLTTIDLNRPFFVSGVDEQPRNQAYRELKRFTDAPRRDKRDFHEWSTDSRRDDDPEPTLETIMIGVNSSEHFVPPGTLTIDQTPYLPLIEQAGELFPSTTYGPSLWAGLELLRLRDGESHDTYNLNLNTAVFPGTDGITINLNSWEGINDVMIKPDQVLFLPKRIPHKVAGGPGMIALYKFSEFMEY